MTPNTFSIDRVTPALLYVGSNDGIHQDRDRTQNHRRNEDRSDENDACIIKELSLQHIVKQDGVDRSIKFIVQWNGYGSDGDTLEPLQHIL